MNRSLPFGGPQGIDFLIQQCPIRFTQNISRQVVFAEELVILTRCIRLGADGGGSLAIPRKVELAPSIGRTKELEAGRYQMTFSAVIGRERPAERKPQEVWVSKFSRRLQRCEIEMGRKGNSNRSRCER